MWIYEMNTSAELKKNLKKFRLERDSVPLTSANALRPNPNLILHRYRRGYGFYWIPSNLDFSVCSFSDA